VRRQWQLKGILKVVGQWPRISVPASKSCSPTIIANTKMHLTLGSRTKDLGPWLGRAIIWKLPVKMHMDGLDNGLTMIFNVRNYTGGDFYLPDLKIKLECMQYHGRQ
jgi:hypothetical protein